jgi:hypothetical protein
MKFYSNRVYVHHGIIKKTREYNYVYLIKYLIAMMRIDSAVIWYLHNDNVNY